MSAVPVNKLDKLSALKTTIASEYYHEDVFTLIKSYGSCTAVDPLLNWKILSNQQGKMIKTCERNIIHLCLKIKLSVSSYQVPGHGINFKRKIIVVSQTFVTFSFDDSGVRILWRCTRPEQCVRTALRRFDNCAWREIYFSKY